MASKTSTKNDIAWEKLFEDHDILNRLDMHGEFVISADQIRVYREPRLMAKFDHLINLPQIFSKHNIAILPVSKRDYVLSHFLAYQRFPGGNPPVKTASLPPYIQSLDPHTITSEAVALNCAVASGILCDFLGEKKLYPTVSGRMGSDQFTFSIHNTRRGAPVDISVSGSQIEIDAALEGKNSLAIVEAKLDLSDDFLVRQLYYPYRLWQSRLDKPVRPVFLVYSNGIFHLYEYRFARPEHYNSLELVQYSRYAVENTEIHRRDVLDVLEETAPLSEPEIPFPQADKMQRVVNLCELLYANGRLDRDEVTERYAFDIRQTNYYTDAGRYLGLMERRHEGRKPVYTLTERGRAVMKLPYRQRQLEFCRCILQHRAFHEAFHRSIVGEKALSMHENIAIMKRSNLYRVEGESTYHRRASTVGSWTAWMIQLFTQPTL